MPALSVKLTPASTFFYVDGYKLTVDIKAKCVEGFLSFFLMDQNEMFSRWK